MGADGRTEAIERAIAVETPVAVEYNGIGYAVLMATPADLEDLAFGFSLAERLIDGAGDIVEVDVHAVLGDADVPPEGASLRSASPKSASPAKAGVQSRSADYLGQPALASTSATGPRPPPGKRALFVGHIVRITLSPRVAERIVDRVRHRASDSSCGLCGIENLKQALRPLPPAANDWRGDDAAVFAALAALDALQPLGRETRAVHAAAACSAAGLPWLVREDVGRHNAFDKLIGAMLRARVGWNGGFALLTSRCSYELVEKAVLARCPMLATISAPTSLALERAAAAGLRLRVLVRPDALLGA